MSQDRIETTHHGGAARKGLNVKQPSASNEKSAAVKAPPIKGKRNLILAIIGALVLLLVIYYLLLVYFPPRPPAIRITVIPPYDTVGGPTSSAVIAGEVSGVTPENFRVVIYALTVNTWYVQPTSDNSRTEIQPDGSWSKNIHTGVRYAALLVRPDFSPLETTSSLPTRTAGVVAATEVEGKR